MYYQNPAYDDYHHSGSYSHDHHAGYVQVGVSAPTDAYGYQHHSHGAHYGDYYGHQAAGAAGYYPHHSAAAYPHQHHYPAYGSGYPPASGRRRPNESRKPLNLKHPVQKEQQEARDLEEHRILYRLAITCALFAGFHIVPPESRLYTRALPYLPREMISLTNLLLVGPSGMRRQAESRHWPSSFATAFQNPKGQRAKTTSKCRFCKKKRPVSIPFAIHLLTCPNKPPLTDRICKFCGEQLPDDVLWKDHNEVCKTARGEVDADQEESDDDETSDVRSPDAAQALEPQEQVQEEEQEDVAEVTQAKAETDGIVSEQSDEAQVMPTILSSVEDSAPLSSVNPTSESKEAETPEPQSPVAPTVA